MCAKKKKKKKKKRLSSENHPLFARYSSSETGFISICIPFVEIAYLCQAVVVVGDYSLH